MASLISMKLYPLILVLLIALLQCVASQESMSITLEDEIASTIEIESIPLPVVTDQEEVDATIEVEAIPLPVVTSEEEVVDNEVETVVASEEEVDPVDETESTPLPEVTPEEEVVVNEVETVVNSEEEVEAVDETKTETPQEEVEAVDETKTETETPKEEVKPEVIDLKPVPSNLPVFTKAQLDLMAQQDKKAREFKACVAQSGDVEACEVLKAKVADDVDEVKVASVDASTVETSQLQYDYDLTGTAELLDVLFDVNSALNTTSNLQFNKPVRAKSHKMVFKGSDNAKYVLKRSYNSTELYDFTYYVSIIETNTDKCNVIGTVEETGDYIFEITKGWFYDYDCYLTLTVTVDDETPGYYLRVVSFSFHDPSQNLRKLAGLRSHDEVVSIAGDSVRLDNGDNTSTFAMEIVYSSLILNTWESKVFIPFDMGNIIETTIRYSDKCTHQYNKKQGGFLINYNQISYKITGVDNPNFFGIRCSYSITTSTLQLHKYRKDDKHVQVYNTNTEKMYSQRFITALELADVRIVNVTRTDEPKDASKSEVLVNIAAYPALDTEGKILVVFNTNYDFRAGFSCTMDGLEGSVDMITLPEEQKNLKQPFTSAALVLVDKFPYSETSPELSLKCVLSKPKFDHSVADVFVYAYTVDYPEEQYKNIVTDASVASRASYKEGEKKDDEDGDKDEDEDKDEDGDKDDDGKDDDKDNSASTTYTFIGLIVSAIAVLCL